MPSQPLVTVIMPIRNEGDFIARSLGAVLDQDYPHDCLEVLVADGLSTDATRAKIAQLSAAHPEIALTVLDNPNGYVPSGMNIALKRAKGAIIVRVDGHTIIAPDYVRQCVTTLQRTQADNVGGRMDAVSTSPTGQAIALATSSPFGIGGGRFHYSEREEWVDTVYMGAWPREVFDRIGLFDEAFVRNQDDEFNYRLLSSGGKILLNPQIKSQYFNRSQINALWKQYFGYGFYKVAVMRKHPRQMRMRQFAPPSLAAALIAGAVFAPFNKLLRNLWLAVVALYTVAVLAASVIVAARQGWRYITRLPLVFAVLHLGYGVGFLAGLVNLGKRK